MVKTDENFEQWKLQITLLLKASKIWGVVNGSDMKPTDPLVDVEAWEQKDMEAQAIIASTLDEINMTHIYSCSSSKEMFDQLDGLHSDSSTLNKQHTLKPEQSLVEAFNEELVASTPSQRNYKGILIALVVICAVCGLIFLSIQLLRPPDEGPRVKGRKITLNDISSKRFLKQPFNGTWISDTEILFRDSLGGVSIFSTATFTSIPLATNTSFRQLNAHQYSVSPDKKFVLLIHEVVPVWDHSFLAKYDFYDIDNQFKTPLAPLDEYDRYPADMQLQYAEWGPIGNEIIFVYQNDIYYKKSVNSSHTIRITTSGQPGVIFNGIPDWLYEVEVLKSNKAFWISSDGKTLIYASYNDSSVVEIFYSRYGESTPYPKLRKWRYPKAGTTNPDVSIWAVKLNSSDEFGPIPIAALEGIDSRDHYISSVNWITNEVIAVIWMNRIQNVAIFALCDSKEWKCREIYTLKPPGLGWLDFPQVPLFSKDLSSCLLRIPWRDGDAGYFHHVIWLDIKYRKEIPLTSGPYEVTEISAWDQPSQSIYFIAVPQGKPGERHLYLVRERSSNATLIVPPTCITCKKNDDAALLNPSDFTFPAKLGPNENGSTSDFITEDPNQPPCLYNKITFSPKNDLFVKECLGPGIPTATLHQAPSGALLYLLNENLAFKREVASLGLPLVKTFQVQISDGYLAPVKLFLPPGFRENEEFKFPLLLHISGSPGSQLVSEKWRISWVSYLTSQKNFIVVEIDARGSGFQGENVRQSVHKQLGRLEVADQLEVIKYLTDNLSFIDEKNMAVWGWGYGGYLTLLALSQDVTNLFQCAIAVSPITKWEYYDTVFAEGYLGMPSNENFDGYEQGDLVRVVEKLRNRKFLIIHGTADEKVHFQHTLYLTKALIKKGLPFTEQVYPDEGHEFRGVIDHLYKTIETYLDHTFEKPDWEDWEKANFLGIAI